MLCRFFSLLVGLAALVGAPSLATAQLGGEPLLPDPDRLMVPLGASDTLELKGDMRFVYGAVGGVAIRAEEPVVGDQTPDDDLAAFRLRLKPALSRINASSPFYALKLQLDAEVNVYAAGGDVPEGLEFDPQWQFRGDQPEIQLNQAYIIALNRYGAIKAGLTRSAFGLGLVARDGHTPDTTSVRESPFGYPTTFDRVARAQATWFPWAPKPGADGAPKPPLAVAVAADAVIEDETAVRSEGDRAWQALGGVFGQRGKFSGGLGGVYRSVEYDEGGTTDVIIGVATARYVPRTFTADGFDLWFEGEFAGVSGETTLSQSPLRADQADVLAVGALGRIGGGIDTLEAVLEAGLASGDDNPFDDEVRTFTFDRDHRVGVLMFSEMARLNAAVTAFNIADQTFREFPARGFDQIPSGGAVQNARYLNPRLAARPFPGVALTLGYVYAVSDEPYADAFRSGLNGGAPTGPRGALRQSLLGQELDAGLTVTFRSAGVRWTTRAQVAVFDPGPVFDDAFGGNAPEIFGAWLHQEASW